MGLRSNRKINNQKSYRFIILLILFLTVLIAYIGRLSTSVALEEIGDELVWSRAEQGFLGGVLMGIFLVPYGFSNMFFSPYIDKYGSKMVLTVSLSGCSFAVFLGAFFGENYYLFLLSRLLLGLSQGVMYPTASKVIAGWFREFEREIANSVFMIGAPMGIILSPIIMGPIIKNFYWELSFYIVSILGFIFLLPIFIFITDANNKRHGGKKTKDEQDNIIILKKFKEFLSSDDFRRMTIGLTSMTAIFWGTILWIPSYIQNITGINLGERPYIAAIPYLGAMTGMLMGPFLNRIIGNLDNTIMISLVMSSIIIVILTLSPLKGAAISIFLLFLVLFFVLLSAPLFFSKLQNTISGKKIGTATGLMNGIGYSFGLLGPVSVGLMIALTGSWEISLLVLSIFGLIGFGSFILSL